MGVRWKNLGAYERGQTNSTPTLAKTMFRMRKSDFVFNRIDTDKGAFCVVGDDLDGAVASNEFPAYVCLEGRLLPEYLWLYFQQSQVLSNLRPAGSEGRARWKEADFERHTIPLPSIDEQRRIVDLVDSVDDVIENATSVAESAYSTYKAFLDRLHNTEHLRPIADVVSVARSGGTPSRKESAYFGGDIPWVKSGEINQDWITTSEERITEAGLQASAAWVVPAGSTLVAMYGQGNTKGTAGLVGSPVATNQAVLALVPKESMVSPKFLLHAVRSRTRSLQAKAIGAAQPNLSKSLVMTEEIPVPALDRQLAITETLEALSSIAQLSSGEADALRVLRAELLSALLSGAHRIPETYDELMGADSMKTVGA